MQIIASEGNNHVFNLARGEELVETLLAWCAAGNIKGATLTGLGAADMLDIAYYNLATKSYERHSVTEEVEILSLNGNLASVDKPLLHIHGVFGKKDLSTFGGHIFSMRVSGACEIHLTSFAKAFERKKDEATGLNLLCGEEFK
jgi:predicted DNA-binding protein with PD1-like motif